MICSLTKKRFVFFASFGVICAFFVKNIPDPYDNSKLKMLLYVVQSEQNKKK